MELLWMYVGSSELVMLSGAIFFGFLCHSLLEPLIYWWKRGVPFIPAFPFFGSMTDSLCQRVFIGEIYMRMYRQLEGKRYGGFLKFSKPSVIVRDPKLIRNVLEVAFPSFHDNDLGIEEELEPLLSRNLFVVTGERWKKLKDDLLPAFSSAKMKAMYPLVGEVCDNLHSFLDGIAGSELDLKDLCSRFTVEIVSSCAFGIHSDAIHIPNSEFHLMSLEMLNPPPLQAAIIMALTQFPWVMNFVPISLFPNKATNYFRHCVREVATHREWEGVQRNDFMALLIQLKKDGKLGIKAKGLENSSNHVDKESTKTQGSTFAWDPESIDDVAAQALGFFVDGSETSATLISFVLFELAHHPTIQKKLRAEIKEARLKHGGNLSYNALEEIQYLEMVVLEALRKYPPASFLARLTTKPYKFPSPEETSKEGVEEREVLLEVDTPIVIPILAIHRDPKYYPDPELFDPERFSEDNCRRRNRFTFLPFGDGPRICIGRRFGLMQSKAAIVTILLSFELMPSDKTLLPVILDPAQFHTSSKNLFVYIRKLKS